MVKYFLRNARKPASEFYPGNHWKGQYYSFLRCKREVETEEDQTNIRNERSLFDAEEKRALEGPSG